MKKGYVYILTNQGHTTLYVGVTSDILRRISQHEAGQGSAFTRKYNLHKLVFLEEYEGIISAIEREKQLKGGSRAKKIVLIERMNPDWRDLSSLLE